MHEKNRQKLTGFARKWNRYAAENIHPVSSTQSMIEYLIEELFGKDFKEIFYEEVLLSSLCNSGEIIDDVPGFVERMMLDERW